MKPYKVHAEDEQSFTIDDGSGKPFRVAKKGLGKQTMAKIKGFAGGGEVEVASEDVAPLVAPKGQYAPGSAPDASGVLDKVADWWRKGAAQKTLQQREEEAKFAPKNDGLTDEQRLMNAQTSHVDNIRETQGGTVLDKATKAWHAPEEVPAAAAPPRQPPGSGQPALAGAPGSGTGGSGRGGGQSRPRADPLAGFTKDATAAADAEKAAIQAKAQVAADASAAKSAVMQKQMEDAAAVEAKRGEMDLAFKNAHGQEEKRFKELVDRYASSEIDPGRFWASRSTGDKILAGIGMIFGLGGGRTNAAVEAINQSIERDIQAQKANLDKSGKAVGMQESLLGQMRQHYGDTAAALNATEAAMRQNAIARIDQTAQRFAGPEAAAAAQQAVAQLSAKLADNIQSAKMEAQVKGAQAARDWAAASAAKTGAGGPKQLPVTSAEKVGAYDAALKQLDDFEKSFGEHAGPLNSPSRHSAKREVTADVVGKALTEGVMSDTERKNTLEKLPGNMTFSGLGKAEIQAVREALLAKRAGLVNAQSQSGYDTSGLNRAPGKRDLGIK